GGRPAARHMALRIVNATFTTLIVAVDVSVLSRPNFMCNRLPAVQPVMVMAACVVTFRVLLAATTPDVIVFAALHAGSTLAPSAAHAVARVNLAALAPPPALTSQSISTSTFPVQPGGRLKDVCMLRAAASSKSMVPCCVFVPVRQFAAGALAVGRSQLGMAVALLQPAAGICT